MLQTNHETGTVIAQIQMQVQAQIMHPICTPENLAMDPKMVDLMTESCSGSAKSNL